MTIVYQSENKVQVHIFGIKFLLKGLVKNLLKK